ncbi:MAG: ATP-binding protein [Cyclobacteriaceae bacterium]
MDNLSQEVTVILIASAFFLLVAIGIIILVLIYQKKQLTYVHEKKQLQSQYDQELLKTRLETQEETLNWLGKELHDNLGQLLNSSKVLIGVAQRTNDTQDTLTTAGETIGQAITELRMLSKSLSKEWLEKFSFEENLKAETRRINATREINMSVDHLDMIEMPRDRQLMLFRMVQEATQNSIKHGNASQIRVIGAQENGSLTVMVIDNGKGFNIDTNKSGFGMNSIRHRASLMGGSAEWNSDVQGGTSVKIFVPIHSSHEH